MWGIFERELAANKNGVDGFPSAKTTNRYSVSLLEPLAAVPTDVNDTPGAWRVYHDSCDW